MGTWDIGFFDNDMACDWENDLKENRDISYIENTLKSVIDSESESLDIDVANRALAASESLAKLKGCGTVTNSYTKHIDNWAKEFNDDIPERLISLATVALEKIVGNNSELRQFWTIRGELDSWNSSIADLKERLTK